MEDENCFVCGRTIEELEREFNREFSMKEHQGKIKCSKCVSEYEKFNGQNKGIEEKSNDENSSWIEKATA